MAEPRAVGASRRRFLGVAASASALLVVTTIGQTIAPLRRLALLAPRHPDIGTQGFPVNRTAIEAGVVDVAADAGYRLSVRAGGVEARSVLPRRPGGAAPTHGAAADRLRRGLERVARAGPACRYAPCSTPRGSTTAATWWSNRWRPPVATAPSTVNGRQLADHDTLLALRVDGEVLAVDHGYPIRLIAPNRPGVLQTKWVGTIHVAGDQ